jgi:5-methyltetrahydrofolate--homocysteine methyltransferase
VAILTPYIEAEKEERKKAQAAGSPQENIQSGAAKILLATVKGDVHDIGKNIVGVVLGCNGYEIIDLGVMVHADKILDTAQKEKVDIIGLSGLITPSLDEMVHVAREMKRRNFQQPLLIGGATTSRMHTAVKIAPEYEQGVVHVLDASRSVTVAGSLLNAELKSGFLNGISAEYIQLKKDFGNKKSVKEYLSLDEARNKKVAIDWSHYTPVKPQFTGTRQFDHFDLAKIAEYIDWGPFFITWEMGGRFPQLLEDPAIGVEARKLYDDARALLNTIIKEKWLRARAVIGFWPALSNGKDTVTLYPDGNKPSATVNLEFLRQQIKKVAGQPNISLADFIKPAPEKISDQNPEQDYIGAFAVTIAGIEPYIRRFEERHDDYNKIMLQALADRLAEAFTELLHKEVRKEFWGYAKEEGLSNDALIKEEYLGIRPAPGYPACPDHTEKVKLFSLLNATEQTGIELTESLAMYPAASVCGWYFSHPQSQYFGVGKILKDQAEDYALRKQYNLPEIEKWLRPVLNYDA